MSTAATSSSRVGRLRAAVAACAIALLGCATLAGCTGEESEGPFQPEWCEQALAVYVRGSGEDLDSDGAEKFRTTVTQAVPRATVLELGESPWSPGLGSYPATRIERNVEPTRNKEFTAQHALEYFASVEQGVEELTTVVATSAATCPETPVALMGYSQGAQIVGATLTKLSQNDPSALNSLAYAALLGDPTLSLTEGGETTEEAVACRGKELSPYRAYVPTCTASAGLLGARTPYVPQGLSGKVGTWCQEADPVCGAGRTLLTWDPHFRYFEDPDYFDDAAQRITAALQGHTFAEPVRFPLSTYYAVPEEDILLDLQGVDADADAKWVLAGHAYDEQGITTRLSFDEFFADSVVATVDSAVAEAAVVVDGLRSSPLGPPQPAEVFAEAGEVTTQRVTQGDSAEGDTGSGDVASRETEGSAAPRTATAKVTWRKPASAVLAYAVWIDHYPVGAVLGNVHEVTVTGLKPGESYTVGVSSLRLDSTSSPLTTTTLVTAK